MADGFTNYPARNAEIYRARESGQTFSSIAKRHGLSVTRVNQIHARQRSQRRRIQERLERTFMESPL